MEWAELYGRKDKPRLNEIRGYMCEAAFEAFEAFNQILLERFHLGYVLPRYTKSKGWYYAYGRSGCILIQEVLFSSEAFWVNGVRVSGMKELDEAIHLVDNLYQDGFLVRYAEFCEARTKRAHEKKQLSTKPSEAVYMRNCKWSKKVSRQDLTRLYQSYALGILDEDLLEDIGLTFYIRCKESQEIFDLMEKGFIKCMHCGNVMKGVGELVCECGRVYTYHAYRRSYREDNMPRGAAALIFDQFVKNWGRAKSAQRKMELIDSLIHEFHIAEISGNKGRPVAVNLIEGTKPQIVKLICELAYGKN